MAPNLKQLRHKYPPLEQQFQDDDWDSPRYHHPNLPRVPNTVEQLKSFPVPKLDGKSISRAFHWGRFLADCLGKPRDDFYSHKDSGGRVVHVVFVHDGKLHHITTSSWSVSNPSWMQMLSLLEQIEEIL